MRIRWARAVQLGTPVVLFGAICALAACGGREPETGASNTTSAPITAADTLSAALPHADYTPRENPKLKIDDEERRARVRREALARAQVWREPAPPIDRADFRNNSAAFYGRTKLACRFHVTEPGGTTQKFDCVLPGGEVVKVKYGGGPEVSAEVAAARLVTALGFAADDMHVVETVRCFGCPEFPFQTLKVVYATRTSDAFERRLDFDRFQDFAWVAVERRFDGSAIETADHEGWSLWELDRIDPARGGAPRHHVDALRLLAVFLAHWDNKDENQRLVCLPGAATREGCRKPLLVLHDLGATFGPRKLNLSAWRAAPIWEGATGCTATMRGLPEKGATFASTEISEAGRRFLAGRLAKLSDQQIHDLFAYARVPERATSSDGRTADEWVAVFKKKVAEIAERRCEK